MKAKVNQVLNEQMSRLSAMLQSINAYDLFSPLQSNILIRMNLDRTNHALQVLQSALIAPQNRSDNEENNSKPHAAENDNEVKAEISNILEETVAAVAEISYLEASYNYTTELVELVLEEFFLRERNIRRIDRELAVIEREIEQLHLDTRQHHALSEDLDQRLLGSVNAQLNALYNLTSEWLQQVELNHVDIRHDHNYPSYIIEIQKCYSLLVYEVEHIQRMATQQLETNSINSTIEAGSISDDELGRDLDALEDGEAFGHGFMTNSSTRDSDGLASFINNIPDANSSGVEDYSYLGDFAIEVTHFCSLKS